MTHAVFLPGILLVTLTAAAPTRAAAEGAGALPLSPGDTVSVLREVGADFTAPDSRAWSGAREYRLDLNLAPPVHASINLRHNPTTPAVPVFLQAASDGDTLYLRLRWPDATQDTDPSRDQFRDGAAVQFALGGGPATSIMMGTAATPVNIWYWQAGSANTQNLAAGGFGSTTRLDRGQLNATSTYRASREWIVVFSRPLDQAGEYQVDLQQDAPAIALALWQGAGKQRDGLKHVSPGWVTLRGSAP